MKGKELLKDLIVSQLRKLTEIDISSLEEQITIEDLRKNPQLQNKVKKELKKIGLTCSNLNSSSSSLSDSSDSSSASEIDAQNVRHRC